MAFLERRAPAAARALVEDHMADCGACRRVLSELTETATPTVAAAERARPGGSREPRPPSAASGPAAPAPDGPLEPGSRVGRYEVRGRVGEGGMGVVYAAFDPELRRPVALKLLRRDLGAGPAGREVEARLWREAQAMAQLAHPNVAAVYDLGHYGEQLFVAMEFVEGQTLARWVERRDRPLRQTLAYYAAAGRGLAAAHAAGLVHRDFKPQNVLVGDDGRVRVVDFGLARSTRLPDAPAPAAAAAAPPEPALALTRTGALLGTPLYMAPEQYRGEPADARSDQFSFCVALYEALYGERPFAGANLAELAKAVGAGRVREPPRGARVPRRLRRVLLRGLSAARGDRFASMDALLEALAADPGRRLRRAALPAATALGVAAAAGLWAQARGERRLLCQGAERHLAQVWDGPRRQAIAAALARTGVPYAEAAGREVGRVFDAYAARWAAAHVEACEATRVRGEQSEEMMGLRMACLDERRRELKALGDQLLTADAALARQAVEAAHGLSELAGCADARALTDPLRPPSDAPARAEVEAVRAGLADARALLHAGRYREGLAAARPLVERAERLGYRPLEAETSLLAGQLAGKAGDFGASERDLEQAAWAAEAGRHDEVAVRALTALLRSHGLRAHYEAVEPLARRVRALLERLGAPAELEARLYVETGYVDGLRERRREAAAALERAVTLLETTYGEGDLRLAEPLQFLSACSSRLGRVAEARAYAERALAVARRALGDEHPDVANIYHDLAGLFYQEGDLAEAEATYRRALAIYERGLGPTHPSALKTLNSLGLVRGEAGHTAEAVALHRRAAATGEQTLGPEHPATAFYLECLATATEADGRPAEALPLHERALGLMRQHYGAEHTRIAETLSMLGRTLLKLDRPREALAPLHQSHAMFGRLVGPGSLGEGDVLQSLGDAELRLGRPARAVASLEGALRAYEQNNESLPRRARTKALLARALWASGGDRARARALAREATEAARADARSAAECADAVGWLRERGAL